MILLGAAIAGLVLLVGFVALEERRRPDVAVMVVVGVLIIDSVLYPHQSRVPLGPFRPSLGGQDLRLPDVVIPVALAARVFVRGLPRRVSGEGLVWLAFFGWYAFAGVVGVVRRQPTDLVLFQGKFVLETGGMAALVAGVPIALLGAEQMLRRLAIVGGSLAAILLPLGAAGLSFDLPLPPGAQLGRVGPDAATILSTLGVLLLVVMACRPRRSPPLVAAGGLMVATPLVADQRAAIAQLVVAVVIVLAAMTGRTWQRRSDVRILTLAPVLCALVLPFGIAAVQGAAKGEGIAATVPLGTRLSETFGSEQKEASGDIRVGLLREGRRLTRSRPLIGRGLGQPVVIINDRTDAAQSIGDFHNVLVDLAVRTGVTGMVLFCLAAATSVVVGLRRWATLATDVHAALCLAATAALGGLLLKGMFETIFQKFRLAVLLGLVVGIIAAAGASRSSSESDRGLERAWT